jgi:hypothetical protein
MRGSNTKPSVALMMVLPWFDKVSCIMVSKGGYELPLQTIFPLSNVITAK